MPHESHKAARSIHLVGTGSWIFDSSEFQQWYQKKQALWITGVRKFIVFANYGVWC